MSVPQITTVLDAPILGTDKNAAFSNKVDQLFGTDLPALIVELNDFANALAVAASSANYSGTSTTSHNIGTGSKTFTTQGGKLFTPGQKITIANTASPGNRMNGYVYSYNIANGQLVFVSERVFGSGTGITAWSIGLSGEQGEGGDVLPAFAGNGGKSLRVNAGETDVEWVDEGWTSIATISGASLNGNTSVSFTGIDTSKYRRLLVTGRHYTAASTTFRFKVGDGVDVENVFSAASQQYTRRAFLLIEMTTAAYPVCFGGIVSDGSLDYANISGRLTEHSPVSVIQIEVSGGSFSATGGYTLYGAR